MHAFVYLTLMHVRTRLDCGFSAQISSRAFEPSTLKRPGHCSPRPLRVTVGQSSQVQCTTCRLGRLEPRTARVLVVNLAVAHSREFVMRLRLRLRLRHQYLPCGTLISQLLFAFAFAFAF